MNTKEEAKIKLAELINTFEANPRKDSLTEQETREFVRSLFEVLNWNFLSGDEVSQEEHISKGFVDYGFRLNGVPKMFVEAKKTANNLSEDKDINQAISYAWSKATTWAVLTNFRRIRIFNAYVKGQLMAAQLNDLELKNYLERFDVLWLLSKDSFDSGLIDIEAEKLGKIAKRMPVEKQLFQDMNKWRELVAKDLKKNYSKFGEEVLDEIIQTLLNRLILIRKIEDIGLEGRILEENYHNWNPNKGKKLSELLNDVFQYFDKEYDSLIFDQKKNELDTVVVSDNVLKEIIPELYRSSDGTIQYDFSYIPADILGNIYEQYLGYLLKTSEKRATLTEKMTKRKEQGIYYTPTYIVEYIVKNTLGEKLKECKTIQDVEKIKVLDPACGSGSFLIRAFDEIYQWYKEKGFEKTAFLTDDKNSHKDFETVKDRIIKNNLFGVDLDQKAVEIARLNLLLKTADKKHKLPQLQENIKVGNSLIDDPTATKHPFSWKIEFEKIFKNGGFDIIIGNPPYINNRNLPKEDKIFFEKQYKTANQQYDIYSLFYELGLNLLKDEGVLGFITPNKFAITNYGENLRKLLLENRIIKIVDVSQLGVFSEASTYPYIVIIQKSKDKKNRISFLKPDITNFQKMDCVAITQDSLNEKEPFPLNFNKGEKSILEKVVGEEVIDIYRAKPTTSSINENGDSFVISNREIEPYKILKSNKKICRKKEWEIKIPAILMKKICFVPTCALLNSKELIPVNTVYVLHTKKPSVSLEYILGILNSKLIGFYARNKFAATAMRGGFIELRTFEIEKIPIKLGNEEQKQQLIKLVEKMEILTHGLTEQINKQANERFRIEEDIKKIAKQINEFVYSIYALSEKEINIVEKFFDSDKNESS